MPQIAVTVGSVAGMTATSGVDRERIFRTLTFWLRPGFVLRALKRFQRVAGFDRAIALASSALTALIPLSILIGAILPYADGNDAAKRIINRYHLTGGGAKAVTDILAPATGTSTDISVIGTLLLIIAVLSFSRGTQRLFEQTWELKPLSVRNTLNDLIWIAGLMLFVLISGWIHAAIDHTRLGIAANLLVMPLSAAFLAWSGRVLSAHRIAWKSLVPFAIVGALLLAIYLTVAAVYVPHLFSSYATRYGVIGSVFAMISALFCVMVVIVASAAVGREVFEELGRISGGVRPPDDEVRREWDAVIDEARSRWQTLRDQIERRRGKDKSAR
jgi:membrane protein